MDTKEKIISFLNSKGPSLPTTIAKQLEDNSFFISAHLSELKSQGKVKISNLKVGGGSPLYYLPGHHAKLQNFSDNLNEKEKKVYDLLKEKKILRDSSLVPVFRAAIRAIKDFAFPFTVNFKGKKELFWKWYLLSNKEAEAKVRDILGIKKKAKENQEQEKEESKEENKNSQDNKGEKISETKEEKEENPQKEEKEEAKKEEKQERLEDKDDIDKGTFYGEVNEYFMENKIRIIEEKIIRKNSDMEFVVEVPSAVGTLKYFVKAKSKKKVNDGDLSSVFITAQSKRLPALFLGKGNLTKKAENMLETEFKGMRFNKIGS